MLEETGDDDAAEFGVMESPADGPGGGLGVGREVSPLLGRGVHGGATRNHGACNAEVIVLFMMLCRRTWDGLQEWQGLAKRVILYESEHQTDLQQLRALQHLTRERQGRELTKRLLLYDIQEQSVQHSLRHQQHRPNMQSGAHQKVDVCVNGRPRRPSRSSFQSDAGQLRATGHHRSQAAASSSPIVRRQTALPYAVVIDQQATLFERLASRFWKPCNGCALTSSLISSLAKIKQMFKSDTVSFERQTIILDQPRHRAGTSCVDRLLCPMLSSLIRMPSCLRGCSQPSFSVRVPRGGLISRLINVFFKSTKMVNSNSLPRVCSFLAPSSFRTLVCVCV